MTIGAVLRQDACGADGPMDKVSRIQAELRQEAMGAQPLPRSTAAALPADTKMCCSLEDWLQPDCDLYRAMHMLRPATWAEVQQEVDEMADRDAFGANGTLEEDVPLGMCEGSEELLREALSARARGLVGRALRVGLPEWISEQMQLDIEEIGMTLARMLPSTPKVVLKLEMMGENSCQRWHQDKFVCRAIVSYNGCGTEYLDHGNVDFWELKNCGMCERIAKNRDEVFSAGIGDILFMKGSKFPSTVNGIVHKSPAKLFHPGGSVVNRLLLKVDVA